MKTPKHKPAGCCAMGLCGSEAAQAARDLDKKRGRPKSAAPTAETWLQARITRERKAAYVKAAKKPRNLSAWAFSHLDAAAGYKAKGESK